MNDAAPPPAGPAADEALELAHFGDLHLWRFGWDGELNPKLMLGLGNLWFNRASRFPAAASLAVIEKLTRESADHVIFTGDLTTAALRSEFEQARMLLEPVLERWPGRFHAIPGNHDRYTRGATRRRHFEQLFLQSDQEYPFIVRLKGRWSLIGFDCSVPRVFSSRGSMSDMAIAGLERALAAERDAGRELLVMGHYPLVYPDWLRPSWEHVLPERARLTWLMREFGVRVYLHGHKHHRWLLEAEGLLHLNCGSAGMDGLGAARRPGFVKLRLEGERISARALHLASGWRPEHSGEGWVEHDLPPQATHFRPAEA